MEEVHYLKQIPLFARLSDALLGEIHSVTVEKGYHKGEVIFMEGEPGEGFHYVQTGKVKIVKIAADGREHIIRIINPGDLFAEVLLFNPRTYVATAIAVEDSRIGVIKNADLEKLVIRNTTLALELIKALSQRLQFAQQKIKVLALDDVAARTAETLLWLAADNGVKLADGRIRVQLDLSRQDLADMVGTTRETVTRTLGMMKKEGLIDFDGHRLLIVNSQKLRTYIH